MLVHPHIPNSSRQTKRIMLDKIGVKTAEELFAIIPENIRLGRTLNLPQPKSESEIRRWAMTWRAYLRKMGGQT